MIEIRINGVVLLRTWDTSAEEIATLQVAAMRQFRRGRGFPVTFVGFQDGLERTPAGHMTVWLHPSMSVSFDYGTTYTPVEVEETRISNAISEMDANELGFIVARAELSPAITSR